MNIKWMWNGIKVDGKLHPAHYSKQTRVGDTKDSITLYAKGYFLGLPNIGVTVKNESDGMTDYFETDRMVIQQSSPFWVDALAAWEKQEAHYKTLMDKRMDKINSVHKVA